MSRYSVLIVFSFGIAGCATLGARAGSDCPCLPAGSTWHATLWQADALAASGRHIAADSLLAEFAARHAGTQPAREIQFWRTLYRLDAQNENGRRSEALAALDSYLQADTVWWYRNEARVLRRLAATPAATPAAPDDTAATLDLGAMTPEDKDREIRQLREHVARLNDELERIRRRLAAPPP
jgi:hypothetical protein